MKTGANSLMNNMDSNFMPAVLPNECDLSTTEEEEDSSITKNEDGNVVVTTDACATPDVRSVEMLSSSVSSVSSLSSEEEVSSSLEMRSTEDDDDLLDLLAETLDVDFDPDLLLL